jgi:hypothetical protein
MGTQEQQIKIRLEDGAGDDLSWKLHPQDDPEDPRWHPYSGGSCRICGQEFSRSEYVRLHVRDVHGEALPPSPHEFWNGAIWTRKTKEETP